MECLEITKRLLGQEHPHVATNINNSTSVYYSQGRYSEAELLFVEFLEMKKRLLGQEHPVVSTRISNLPAVYQQRAIQ